MIYFKGVVTWDFVQSQESTGHHHILDSIGCVRNPGLRHFHTILGYHKSKTSHSSIFTHMLSEMERLGKLYLKFSLSISKDRSVDLTTIFFNKILMYVASDNIHAVRYMIQPSYSLQKELMTCMFLYK